MKHRKPGRGLPRRSFLKSLLAAPGPYLLNNNLAAGVRSGYYTVINHWHQAGIGFYLRRGALRGKNYGQGYSLFYGVQKTIDALTKWSDLAICLDFDSYAYEVMEGEDPAFVKQRMRQYVDTGRLDIVGGTYSQPYSQLIGWQSNVRQLLEGRATVRNIFGKDINCFVFVYQPERPLKSPA